MLSISSTEGTSEAAVSRGWISAGPFSLALRQSDVLWRPALAVTFEGFSWAPGCPHEVGGESISTGSSDRRGFLE